MTELSLDQLRERAREGHHHEDEGGGTRSVVAVLIMVVTLLAAATAYLQAHAGTKEAQANRTAEEAAVAILTAFGRTGSNFSQEYTTRADANDLYNQAYQYATLAGQAGTPRKYALALTRAYQAAAAQVDTRRTGLFADRFADRAGGFDYEAFYEQQQRTQFAPIEEQRAAAAERGDWSSKRGRYVAVITIFAVALFLLGLTLTVPPGARRPFLVAGCAVALAAAAWDVVVFAGSVPKPNAHAIDSYVEGAARYALADIVKPGRRAEVYREAIPPLTEAIDAKHDYVQAYERRGGAYFRIDLLEHPQPRGSEQARDDFARATELAPDDPIAWGNLGAARFYLADYRGALSAARRSVDLQPGQPLYLINLAETLIVNGREREYARTLDTIRTTLAAQPDWARAQAIGSLAEEGRRAAGRPILRAVTRFVDDVLTIEHQIEVGQKYYGTTTPPRTTARVRAFRYERLDARRIRVQYSYGGVRAGSKLLYQTYVDGVLDPNLSLGPRRFSETGLDVPAGEVDLTLPRPGGWKPGTEVRLEIFFDGNLLAGRTYRVP